MQGIIFDADSVRAMLAGLKTRTTRAMKPQPEWPVDGPINWFNVRGDLWTAHDPRYLCDEGEICECLCPHHKGKTLYVKEAFRVLQPVNANGTAIIASKGDCGRFVTVPPEYRDNRIATANGKRFSPLHMPEWASRGHVTILSAEPVRLQDMTYTQLEAEGLPGGDDPRIWWRQRWVAVNGEASWLANPWCWHYAFRWEAKP